MKTNITFLLALLLCIVVSTVQAQTSGSRLQNLDVQTLSDKEIESYIKQARESGYSQQQLEMIAKARGMSSAQIAQLKSRVEKIEVSTTKANTDEFSRIRTVPEVALEGTGDFDPYEVFSSKTDGSTSKTEVFGMSFFSQRTSLFSPSVNTPTPANYLLGPGDELIIDIWGASETTYRLTISPEGSIIIPKLGPIYMNGLTIERAESKLGSKLKSIFANLGDNTFYQVSLGSIRTISVNVVGEVISPGTYQMSSFGTPLQALYLAGGPSTTGSLREILVLRTGSKIAELDAYEVMINGESNPLKLQDEDVVLVKPYLNRVEILGEVKRPAKYELKSGEALEDALEYAGGFTGEAYTKTVSLERNAENFKTVKTVSKEDFASLEIKDGDKVQVARISGRFINRLRVEGAVNHPGVFEYLEEMKLSDVLELSDGLRPDAFLKRGLIIRENNDLTLTNLSFVPEEIIKGQSDVELRGGDIIRFESIFDLRESYMVSLHGEVRNPGQFPFVAGMTVEDLILLGGGFKESAAKSSVEISRRITEDPNDDTKASELFTFPISEDLSLSGSASEFELKPFDLVVIRRLPYYEEQSVVEVDGEVKFPGKYALQNKTERISDLIKRSGGFTEIAFVEGATLIRKSDYYAERGENRIVADVRREELLGILERDTLVDEGNDIFKKLETIGIELDRVMKNPGSEYDLILKPGDIVSVPRKLQIVRIKGEVLRPGSVRYSESERFKSFVGQAGGFSDRARKRKSYVVYANGMTAKTSSFLWWKHYPKVEPGSELIVPEKPERRRMTPQEIIGISTGLATLSLVINNLTR